MTTNELNSEIIQSALKSLEHVKREALNSKEQAWLDMAKVFLGRTNKSISKEAE